MSKERESRRRSPCIIARLMGIESMPPHQPENKQQKMSVKSCRQRTESVEPMRTNTLYEECSYRKSLKEEQGFKDVFEVLETRNGSSKLTEAKMAFFRQKVMDAKRFSTDENLQVSKEFDDTLEVLESNKGLFLECLQERNTLFSKHLHDLQNPPSRSRQRHYDGYLSRPYDRGTHNALKSSRFPLEEEDRTSNAPASIVVLKPNLGRTQNVAKSASSPHPSYTSRSDIRLQTELPNMKGKETELRRKKYNPGSSSVNNEAKKRLSERWNTGHGFEDIELAGRSSILGEMLAISDRPANAKKLGTISDCDRRLHSFTGIRESFEGVRPLGISSNNEGWMDACIESLSRSRSLPSSIAAFESSKPRNRHGNLENDRYLSANNAINLGRSKAVKKHLYHKISSSSIISRSSAKKLKPSQYADQNIMLSETSIGNTTDRIIAVGAVMDVEVKHGDLVLFSEPSDDSSTQGSDHFASKEPSNEPYREGSSSLIGNLLGPESPSSPKEAEQPSPVSVLEIPFPNDLPSGSECFDSVSADLQGLRMQLQLLKLESEEYAEGMMAISSDEDETEESLHITNEAETTLIAEENWESSFMADVLIHSGFANVDPYTFMATCPVADSIFQTLEKKYCSYSNWSSCEGKLLFDRVNSALVDTCRQFTDPHPWLLKSLALQMGCKKSKEVSVEDCLYKLLENQDTIMSMDDDLTETVMETGSQRLHLEDAIDEIGIEFVKMLMDEMVREIVTM